MNELKPCPFCRSDVKLYVDDGVCVFCKKCGAKSICLKDYYNGLGIKSNAVERVIEAWNRMADEVSDD